MNITPTLFTVTVKSAVASVLVVNLTLCAMYASYTVAGFVRGWTPDSVTRRANELLASLDHVAIAEGEEEIPPAPHDHVLILDDGEEFILRGEEEVQLPTYEVEDSFVLAPMSIDSDVVLRPGQRWSARTPKERDRYSSLVAREVRGSYPLLMERTKANELMVMRMVTRTMETHGVRRGEISRLAIVAVDMVFTPDTTDIFSKQYRNSTARRNRQREYDANWTEFSFQGIMFWMFGPSPAGA